jgi:CSLREA domain-containing protein
MTNRCVIALLAVFAALLVAAPAHAATFVVTEIDDTRDGQCNGDCSLREALDAANANAAPDEIVLPAGTLQLTLFGVEDENASGDIDIRNDVTIRGQGAAATKIQSTLPDRVFDLRTSAADLRLLDLTVTGGEVLDPNDRGGGIRAAEGGELLLERVVVSGNVSRGAAANGFGGGIFMGPGALLVRDSAILGNVATGVGFGGGIFVDSAASAVTLTNVTIADNLSTGGTGGGILFNGPVAAAIVNTTITGNQADSGGGGIGGVTSKVWLRSSILAGNKTETNEPDCEENPELTSEGGNVIAAECGTAGPGDALTSQPLLGALTASAVPVLEPLAGSPALDRAVGPCPATDARGVARPQGPGCDAGAAELPVAAPPAPAPAGSAPATVVAPSKAGLKALPAKLKLKEGKVSVTLSCLSGPACAGNLKLTKPGPARKAKRAPVVLAQKGFSIAGGQQAVVKAPLTKLGKAAAEGRRSLGATLTVKLNGVVAALTQKVQISR